MYTIITILYNTKKRIKVIVLYKRLQTNIEDELCSPILFIKVISSYFHSLSDFLEIGAIK